MSPSDYSRRRAALRAGEFEEFLRHQYREILQFVKRRTLTLQDAEDVAQESMLKMLRYREVVAVSDRRRLLFRIAVNATHDRSRDARYRHAHAHVSVDECTLEAPARLPDECAAQDQLLSDLRGAILRLPAKCRRVYLLKLVYEMTNLQIAERCGISVKMVEKHLANGLAALRKGVGNSGLGTFRQS